MILTRVETIGEIIELYAKDYHPIMWRWIVETFKLPEDTVNVTMNIDALAVCPRIFENEKPLFIPVDEKSILKA